MGDPARTLVVRIVGKQSEHSPGGRGRRCLTFGPFALTASYNDKVNEMLNRTNAARARQGKWVETLVGGATKSEGNAADESWIERQSSIVRSMPRRLAERLRWRVARRRRSRLTSNGS